MKRLQHTKNRITEVLKEREEKSIPGLSLFAVIDAVGGGVGADASMLTRVWFSQERTHRALELLIGEGQVSVGVNEGPIPIPVYSLIDQAFREL